MPFAGEILGLHRQFAFNLGIAGLQQQTITFDNLATGVYDPLVTSGVTFVGNCLAAFCTQIDVADEANWTFPFFHSSTGNSLTSLNMIGVTLPPGVTAVGFLVGSSLVVSTQSSSGAGLSIPGGPAHSVALDPANPFPFLGIVSDSPISSLTISSGPFLTIDDFTFASGSVPEPATFAFCSIAIGGAGYLYWRRYQLRKQAISAEIVIDEIC